jgi:hypothetical protein
MPRERVTFTNVSCARGAAAGLLFGACLVSRDARADFDFQFSTSLSGAWVRETPTFTSNPVTTNAREIGEGRVRTGRGLAMLGLGVDSELTLDDRWRVPLLGANIWWAVGPSDLTVTSLDGSVASVRPWSMSRGDVLLPGLGRRWKHRRNMWGAAVRTGVSFASMGGSLSDGAGSVPLELFATTFLVQLELEGCRRLDPTMRACVQISPRIYDHDLFNGVTFGLRLEWGR